eukprot:3623398-Pleurochrysis_carterae.AAC.1
MDFKVTTKHFKSRIQSRISTSCWAARCNAVPPHIKVLIKIMSTSKAPTYEVQRVAVPELGQVGLQLPKEQMKTDTCHLGSEFGTGATELVRAEGALLSIPIDQLVLFKVDLLDGIRLPFRPRTLYVYPGGASHMCPMAYCHQLALRQIYVEPCASIESNAKAVPHECLPERAEWRLFLMRTTYEFSARTKSLVNVDIEQSTWHSQKNRSDALHIHRPR